MINSKEADDYTTSGGIMQFPCTENPVRCFLTCKGSDLRLACSAKGIAYASSKDRPNDEEFTLIPTFDNSVILKSTKHNRFLCSDSNGALYAAQTCHGDLEKWTLADSQCGGFYITSTCNERRIIVDKRNCSIRTTDSPTSEQRETDTWFIEFNSGEICFLSTPSTNMRLRCNLVGQLSMSKHYNGWEAWRFSEAGGGCVRISSWAHGQHFICSNNAGKVYITEIRGERGNKWTVQKAPPGCEGVLIKSAAYGRILQIDNKCTNSPLSTTAEDTSFLLDEARSWVWKLESAHQQRYYLVCNHNNTRVGTSHKGIYTTKIPIRRKDEEWKLEGTGERGVVTLMSQTRKKYLRSTACGKVLLSSPLLQKELEQNKSIKWILKESPEGRQVLVSKVHTKYLVCHDGGHIRTVTAEDHCKGNLWRLEPRLPHQVTKASIQSIATAATVGIATTIACPVILGGAIGLMGITQAGVATNIVTGSIRAAETISSISRMASSSSKLMYTISSVLSDGTTSDSSDKLIGNRPFCAWASW